MEKRLLNQAQSDHILLLARKKKISDAEELINLAMQEIVNDSRPAVIHFAIACVEVLILAGKYAEAEDSIERLEDLRILEVISYRNARFATPDNFKFDYRSAFIIERLLILTQQARYHEAWECISNFDRLPRYTLPLINALASSLWDQENDYLTAKKCFEFILKIDPNNEIAIQNHVMMLIESERTNEAFLYVTNRIQSRKGISNKMSYLFTVCNILHDWGEYSFSIRLLGSLNNEILTELSEQKPELYHNFLRIKFENYFRMREYRKCVIVGKKMYNKFNELVDPVILGMLVESVDLSDVEYYENGEDVKGEILIKLLQKAVDGFNAELKHEKEGDSEMAYQTLHFLLIANDLLRVGIEIDWSKAPWNENKEDF